MAQINLSGSISATGVAILGNASVVFSSDANHTMSVSEYTNYFIEVTSSTALTATRNLIAPVVSGQCFIVQNNTTGGQSIQVIGNTGTGVTIGPGQSASVFCDGTNYFSVSGSSGGNPVFTNQTDWYLDGYAGNDGYDGKTPSTPVKTITGGIITRWGTTSPVLPQTVTIHILNGQAANLERAVIQPIMTGASNFVVVGTPSNVGSSFSAGTVTAKLRAAPGNDLQIANMPGGTTAGMLVRNTTRSSSAYIVSMNGTTATLAQPFTDASLTTVAASPGETTDDAWATGNTLQLQSVPLLNIEVWLPTGGDASLTVASTSWLQFVRIPDFSGSPAFSTFPVKPHGIGCVFSACWVDSYLAIDGELGGYAVQLLGCYCPGAGQSTNATLLGGYFAGGFSWAALGSTTVALDCILNNGIIFYTTGSFFNVHAAGLVSADSGASITLFGIGNKLWGTYNLQLFPLSVFDNSTSTSWATTVLTTGLLQFQHNGANTTQGWAEAANGLTYGPYTITAANIDAVQGIMKGSNGARFTGGNVGSLPSIPVTWSQSTWYFDPANSSGNASDNNIGSSSGAPLLTWNGVRSKLGTHAPVLPQGQSMTFNQLSAQTVGSDPIVFEPYVSGGGQIALIVSLATLQASVTAGTVTPQNLGTGQLLTVAGITGAAAGQYVFNSTRNSYAIIESVSVGVSTMSQPLTAASVTTIGIPIHSLDQSWATGDTLVVYSRQTSNITLWRAKGMQSSAGAQVALSWVQWASIPDPSGANASAFPLNSDSGTAFMSGCQFLGRLHVGSNAGRGTSVEATGCDVSGPMSCISGGLCTWTAGIIRNTLTIEGGHTLTVGNNAIMRGAITLADGLFDMGGTGAYLSATLSVLEGGSVFLDSILWGTGGITLGPGSTVFQSGSTFVGFLRLTGTLQFAAGATMGYAIASNYTYGPFLLTAANMDTYNGLQDLATGARFCNGSMTVGPSVPITWSQSTWHINGQTGNDTTGDGSSGNPFATFTNGLYPRWGTRTPSLSQTTTISIDGYQNIGQERFVFSPTLLGASTNVTIDGTSGIIYGAPFTAGTVTQFVWGHAGNAMTIASMPGSPSVGQIITNTTRGTNAIIRAVSGSTVTVTIPLTVSTGVPDLSWLTGDTLKVGTLPYLNLVSLHGNGGDDNSSGTAGIIKLLHTRVPDISGVAGFSSFTVSTDGLVCQIVETVVDSFAFQPTTAFVDWIGCVLLGGCELRNANMAGGSSTFVTFYDSNIGSVFTTTQGVTFVGLNRVTSMACEGGGNTQINVEDNATLVLAGSTETQGYGAIWTIGTQCHMGLAQGAIVRQQLASNPGTIWSHVLDFQQIYFTTGTHGYNTASSFIPATNTWHTGIALTVANLDAWGALYDGTLPVVGQNPTSSIPYSGAGLIGQYSPSVPPTWTQSTWFIDPSGTHGGSDGNSGLTSGAPLLTWKGAIAKLATTSPILKQTTTITFLSSHTDNTDPVIFSPILSNASCIIQGTTPSTTAATFTRNTAKNTAVGSNSLLSGSFSAGTPAKWVLVTNTTAAKSSRAWINSSAGGANWNLTQPCAPLTVPNASNTPTEVDTWNTGDTVTLSSPIAINIVSVSATITQFDSSFTTFLWLYNLTVLDPGTVVSGLTFDPITIGSNVQVTEVTSQRPVQMFGNSAFHTNIAVQNYLTAEGGADTDPAFFAGAFGSTLGSISDFQCQPGFGNDIIINGPVQLDTGCLLFSDVFLGGNITVSSGILNLQSGILYGTGSNTINMTGQSRFANTSGQTFVSRLTAPGLVTGIKLNGTATGHSVISGSPDVFNGGIATTPTNLDATAGASGFGGLAFNLGGASIANSI